VPPRKPSPVGAHVPLSGAGAGLVLVDRLQAEAVQVFTGNPRGWAPPRQDPAGDARFAAGCAARRIPVFVHAPYLVNLASPAAVTRTRSAAAVRSCLERARRLGARAVVIHAGSAVDADHRGPGLEATRELLLPILDGLSSEDPDVLIEPTAGGGQPLAATVTDLGPVFDSLDSHPRLGVCLDTCHAFAAGHDIAAPGGVRKTLTALVRTVGRGRLKLVHANDSKDPLGSRRDRHMSVGHGEIGIEPFAELFRHPATRGVPVVIEAPGSPADHARDIATLKQLRDG
jgi:deoxyribonuclease-4